MINEELTPEQKYAHRQKQNFPNIVKMAREEVESVLCEPLSLGDRMILKNIARQSMSHLLKMVEDRCSWEDVFPVQEEAAFLFLRYYTSLESKTLYYMAKKFR